MNLRNVSVQLAALALIIILFGCTATQKSGPFKAQYDPKLIEPEVVVKNNTTMEIELQLSGPEVRTMHIPANAAEKVTVKPGDYFFTASAAGVQPISGNSSFAKNYRYTWAFHVVAVRY
jgi:hypothetical protein